MTSDGLKRDAMAIYDAALAGVEPGRATARALGNLVPAPRVWLLAVGKAAPAMLDAALEHLTRLNQAPMGGVLVSSVDGQPPDFRVERITGDHPLPGTGSARAAAAIVDLARR